MIGFQAPLWLLLLVLIPLIRWLHQFSTQSRILPSTTLFLWSGLQRRSAEDGSPGKPDPRWILRAMISALLILALAKPQLQDTEGFPVEVWIDDSLSMFTREQGYSRMQAGLQRLQSYLSEGKFSHIRLHSLGEPAAVLSLEPKDNSNWAAQLNDWVSRPPLEPQPPPLVTLSKQSNHILLTDGADSLLNRWAQSAPLTHVFRVGELRQNLALSRLNLRNSLTDSGAIMGTARVDNLGDIPNNVRLVIKQQENIIKSLEFEIQPLGNKTTTFSITPGEKGLLEAQLENGNDALSLDNSLKLDIADLQSAIRYSLRGDCNPRFLAVINSHPAFIRADRGADLLINCGAETQNPTLPTLRLHHAISVHRTTLPAHWHSELSPDYLPIAAGVAYSNEAPALSSANHPILSANGRMLILKKPGTGNVIDCYLDTGDAAFSREAQYPLLIFAMISRLTERSLETSPLTIGRDIRASRIIPMAFPTGAASLPAVQPVKILFTNPILIAVLLLLVMDAALSLFAASGKLNWQS